MILLILALILLVLFVWSTCIISGRCSRIEEQLEMERDLNEK